MVGGGEGDRVGGGGGGGAGVGGGQQFVDRSKVRILLCDGDANSSQEVLRLLCNCSYQVTCAKSPRQVINILNYEGGEIDIILAEVDLPVTKCFKMLKYIARNKDLRHIPIIMMSNRDEVSVVVKCLRFGAAEYLVKPLRTNELLNLWTHVWRRRRMLGLPEKNFFNDNFELVLSEPSDANTNSTTLLSDETDDRPKENTNQETGTSNQREYESNPSIAEPEQRGKMDGAPDSVIGADQALPEETCSRSERRAAALAKFRQKRKERCFDKKVRYVNRKKLAETRPRVRGQFVRQTSNTDIISTGDDISEDEDDDPSSREVEIVSSPE
nr:unnamed protein product [Digitaria exilis]